MYGILCKLCGWSETDHSGGLSPEEAEDEQYHKPLEGYERPLITQIGEVDHVYDCSDPVTEQKSIALEKEERGRAGINPYSGWYDE